MGNWFQVKRADWCVEHQCEAEWWEGGQFYCPECHQEKFLSSDLRHSRKWTDLCGVPMSEVEVDG